MNIRKLLLYYRNTAEVAPTFTGATFSLQNTTVTNDLAADGYSWSQAHPIVFDNNGNLITLAQRRNGGNTVHCFTWKNVGDSWQDANFTEGFLARGSITLDATNNVIHVLWNAIDAADGIIYRRYTITYSGSDITAITKDTNVNLQLDLQSTGSMQYEHPIMTFLSDTAYGTYGAILATWSARNAGTGNQIRSSLCVLDATADSGKTAGNWQAVTTASASHLGNQPAVTYSVLADNTNTAVMYQSIGRSSDKDLMLFYFDGGNVRKLFYRRAIWNAANNDWRDGLTTAQEISNVVRTGTDGGYNLKDQLGTKVVEDSNNNIWFGFANWKNNTDGDTISLISVKNDVLSSLIDVYSVGAAHSYAPCVDIDTYGKYLIVAYINTTDQDIYLAAYKNTTQSTAPTSIYTTRPVDIPLIKIRGNKAYFVFRDTINTPTPPYTGIYGEVTI